MNARALASAAADLTGGGGLLGVLAAALPIVALASLALLPYAWPKRGGVLPAPLVVWGASFVACAIAAASLVAREWAAFVRATAADAADPSEKLLSLRRHTALPIDAQLFVAVAVLVALPPIAFVLARRTAFVARREGADGRAAWLVASAVTAIGCAAALGVARAMDGLSYYGCGISPAHRYELFLEAFAPIDTSRAAVLGVAAVASVALVTAALSRARLALAGRALGAPVLVTGALAWGATRDLAHDAEHPLPFLEGQPSPVSIELPPAPATCKEPEAAPVLAIEARGVTVDGAPVKGAAELAEKLRAKRRLWEILAGSRPPPRILLVAAAPQTRREDVEPLLAIAREAGFPDAQRLYARPRGEAQTATAGRIGRTVRVCASPIE